MKCVLFYHAFTSCWNNGNAHFLRGVARELVLLGHHVTVYEPADGWSRQNARLDGGANVLREAAVLIPGVDVRAYDSALDLDAALDGADLVVVHEWNEPALVAAIGRKRALGAPFTLLFHDTHHRAVTAPHELARFDLAGYDGVLAFGEVLRDIYQHRGWGRHAFTWHEAADTALFRPAPEADKQIDLVWIGNWGDDERSAEIHEYLIEPVAALGLSAEIHGVRYPAQAREAIQAAGIAYRGWLPNHCTPAALSRARMTVHIPRRPYAEALRGIPTIRVFEALACGIALVSAPWCDEERLFPADCFLRASSGSGMKAALRTLLHEPDRAAALAAAGLKTIRARHTCRHRAFELLAIVAALRGAAAARVGQHASGVAA